MERRPHLSVLALTSFLAAFAVTRVFTMLSPRTTFSLLGFHIHHFWYGIIMIAVAGWLGISYKEPRIDEFAAVIFGAGGALIGDEVGILLPVEGSEYWTEVSYTSMVVLITSVLILALIARYSRAILKNFVGVSSTRAGFYFAVLLAAISIAFLIDTHNPAIIAVSGALTAVACLLALSFSVQTIHRRIRRAREKYTKEL
jgi:hypothetical protein